MESPATAQQTRRPCMRSQELFSSSLSPWHGLQVLVVDLSSGVAEHEDMTRTPSAVLADNAADQAHDHDPTDERSNWVSCCTLFQLPLFKESVLPRVLAAKRGTHLRNLNTWTLPMASV